MEINKKNRTVLKSYFLANKIPTQKNFEEFIDANLNQAEDGILKTQGSPIALQAEGDSGGTQEVLNLYTRFADTKPSWGINLNPRVDTNVPGSNKPGLNFKNSTGASQLFIHSIEGNIGVGTIEPTSRLSIQARDNASMISVISNISGSSNIFEVTQEDNNGALAIRSGNGALVSKISGAANKPSFFLSKVGVGTDTPEANLHIKGEGPEIRISNTKSDMPPHLSFHHADGKFWDITSKGALLEFTPMGNESKKLSIQEDGSMTVRGQIKTPETAVVAFSVALKTDQVGNKNPLKFEHYNFECEHFKENAYFIAPVAGTYLFSMSMLNYTDSDVEWYLRLNVSGYVNAGGASNTLPARRTWCRSRLDMHTSSRTVMTKLRAGDKVHIEQKGGGTSSYVTGFEGVLIQAYE